MKILILDDDRIRHTHFIRNFSHHEVTNVETAEEAIKALADFDFDAVFLDHDLGGEIFVNSFGPILNTGYTVAKWLAENPDRRPKHIYVHSLNPIGAKNIQDVLSDAVLVPRPLVTPTRNII